ncbi:MAG: hypothetical protein EA376_12985 [Phycisphaeraceae bacterium]|nr:MAG: hypothetical protein EA376_12985 [Phycisphaeraceae bacterium]
MTYSTVQCAAFRGIVARAAIVVALLLPTSALAQPQSELAPAVQRLLEAPYLSEEERADKRVFHGVWRPEDLENPARRAQAALIVGAWDDPVFDNPDVAPEDRAEALLRRGELTDALDALSGVASIRAIRIRAEALDGLGRFEEADAALEPAIQRLLRDRIDDAEQLVEGVRCLAHRARLRGEPASHYRQMMGLLGRARDDLDRLHWPAMLAEARLLYDKDNRQEALQAVAGALALNPAIAEAWAIRGRIAVDGFNFRGAEVVAEHLRELEARLPGRAEHSPIADIILTSAWLRQNDPGLAEDQLEPTLDRYPHLREALAVRCAIEAVGYDFDAVERMLESFDELSPGSPLALFTVGKALAENRQYLEAADFLERASARQPNWPAPMIELGLLELQSGRDLRAARALRRVAELDPFNRRAANSLILIEELLTYDTVENDHFIVRFRPGPDRILAEEMLKPLEEIHRVVSDAFDHEPDRRTVLELMPDHEWFAVRIVGMPGIHTIAAATGPVIAMETPRIGPGHSGVYDWIRVVRHEYAHTVTLSKTRNRIPHWFTEAAAVHLELAPRDYDTIRLLVGALENDALFDMRQINIAFVRPEKPTDRAQAYAQGHWMYEHIIERYGERAPLEMMDLYADGLREEAVIRSVLGVSREEFYEGFKPWAREQARSWGLLASPTIPELLIEESIATDEAREKAEAALEQLALEAGFAAGGVGRAGRFDIELPEPSREMVDHWLEARPDHADILELAVTLELRAREGDPDASMIPLLERYAQARPVDPMPHRLLARLRLRDDATDARIGAIPHLEFLDAREQRSSTYAIELADIYSRAGDLENASRKARRATHIAPFNAANREQAARVALLKRDYAEALTHLEALTVIEPDRAIHTRRLERLRELMAGNE